MTIERSHKLDPRVSCNLGIARDFFLRRSIEFKAPDQDGITQIYSEMLPPHPVERKMKDNLIATCRNYMSDLDISEIEKASAVATYAHRDQLRDSGEPYSSHLFRIAQEMVDEYQVDAETVVLALLHDSVEDGGISIEEIRENFGNKITDGIDFLTKVGEPHLKGLTQSQATLLKVMDSLLTQPRAALVKLYDRRDYFRTLKYKIEKARGLGISKDASIRGHVIETEDVYATLAKRMGMFDMAQELEYWCLYYAGRDYEGYAEVLDGFINGYFTQEKVGEVKAGVKAHVKDTDAIIYHRLPRAYDIYRQSGEIKQPEDKDMYMHAGVILDDGDNQTDTWDERASGIYYKFSKDRENWTILEPPEVFPDLIAEKLVDSMRFLVQRKIDGLRVWVHIYPKKAYIEEQARIPLAFRPKKAGVWNPQYEYLLPLDRIAQNKDTAKQKLTELKRRYRLARGRNGQITPAERIALGLEPRDPIGMIRVIGRDRNGVETFVRLRKDARVIDYIQQNIPQGWPFIRGIWINGEKEDYEYVLKRGDVVYFDMPPGERPVWDPKMIHLYTDERIRMRLRDEIRKIEVKEKAVVVKSYGETVADQKKEALIEAEKAYIQAQISLSEAADDLEYVSEGSDLAGQLFISSQAREQVYGHLQEQGRILEESSVRLVDAERILQQAREGKAVASLLLRRSKYLPARAGSLDDAREMVRQGWIRYHNEVDELIHQGELLGGGEKYLEVVEAGRWVLGRKAQVSGAMRLTDRAWTEVEKVQPGISQNEFLFKVGIGDSIGDPDIMPELLEKIGTIIKEDIATFPEFDVVFATNAPRQIRGTIDLLEEHGVSVYALKAETIGEKAITRLRFTVAPMGPDGLESLITLLGDDRDLKSAKLVTVKARR
jgi:hypothetical protein